MFDTTSRKKFVASFPDSFLTGAEVGVSSGDFSKNILSVTKNIKLYCVDIMKLITILFLLGKKDLN
jgi:hypothetical protein